MNNLILLISIFYSVVSAQYEQQWENIWDSGLGGSFDVSVAAAAMPDGGVVTLGIASKPVLNDIIVRRMSENGNEIWSQRFETISEFTGKDLIYTQTGMIVVTGREEDSSGTYNTRTILLNSDGVVQWDTVFTSNVFGASEEPYKLAGDSSGGIYIVGTVQPNFNNDISVLHYSIQGDLEWVTTFDGPFGAIDLPVTLVTESGGSGYVIGRFSSGPNEYAGGVFRINKYGSIAWWDTTDLNFMTESKDCALLDQNGQLIVLGNSINGFSILRYDSSGVITGRMDFNTPAVQGNNTPLRLIQRPSGEIIAVGESWDTNIRRYRMYFQQVSENLDPIWTVNDTLNINSFTPVNPAITLADDGTLYYSGEALQIFVKSIDINGNINSVLQDSISSTISYSIKHIQINSNNEILLDGHIRNISSKSDLYSAYYIPSGLNSLNDTKKIPNKIQLLQNFPNPFNPVTAIPYQLSTLSNVQLNVFNLMGQKVKTLVSKQQSAGNYNVQWDGTNDNGLSVSGSVFLYRLQSGDFVKIRKMILLK